MDLADEELPSLRKCKSSRSSNQEFVSWTRFLAAPMCGQPELNCNHEHVLRILV